MRETKIDMLRSLNNVVFFISTVLIMVVVVFGAGFKTLFPQYGCNGLFMFYHSEILVQGIQSDIVMLVIPIVCTLPYTTAFLDEYTSGYIKFYLLRCDKSEYIKGKIIAPIVSGGLCIFIGMISVYILLKIIYAPMEVLDENAVSPFINVLSKACLFFFSGAFWANIGLLLANITLSKYMAYASPFVIFNVLVILQERYFREFYIMNPKEWLQAERYWVMGRWGVVIILVFMIGIMLIVNFRVIEKRISDKGV